MNYYIVEQDILVKPLYSSFFPRIVFQRSMEAEIAKVTKQFQFKKVIHLFVDDPLIYKELGGSLGEERVERFRITDYPSFHDISRISTYAFPSFIQVMPCRGGLYPDGYAVKGIGFADDEIRIESVLLHYSPINDGFTKVKTVFFDHLKSWNKKSDINQAKPSFEKTVEWLRSQINKHQIKSLESGALYIKRLLNPSEEDSGIVRKAKIADYCLLMCAIRAHMDKKNTLDISDSVFQLAKNNLYSIPEDKKEAFLMYGINDVSKDYYSGLSIEPFLNVEAKRLVSIFEQAKALDRGLYDRIIEIAWAKKKIEELQSEWNESGIDTSSQDFTETWCRDFRRIVKRIKEL